jgi:hypothetical protein
MQAARIFAHHRQGISVRELARKLGVAKKSAERILTLFRNLLLCEWKPVVDYPPKVLIAEVQIAPRIFETNPPNTAIKGWRLLLICGLRVGANDRPLGITSMRAVRLANNTEEVLASAVRNETQKAAKVYGFTRSRCQGTIPINYKTFSADRVGASPELVQRLRQLKGILVQSAKGKFQGEKADGLLAEFCFRQAYRLNKTDHIAGKLLELLLSQKVCSYNKTTE